MIGGRCTSGVAPGALEVSGHDPSRLAGADSGRGTAKGVAAHWRREVKTEVRVIPWRKLWFAIQLGFVVGRAAFLFGLRIKKGRSCHLTIVASDEALIPGASMIVGEKRQ